MESKAVTMGWLAKVPSSSMCPTGHRYLRSPCQNEQGCIYLGGPISLANFDKMDMVVCKRFISNKEPWKNKIGVSKSPKSKLARGQEILWSYNLPVRDRSNPQLFSSKEWKLVSTTIL